MALHIEHDDNLLSQARAVFGEDLVVAAYVMTTIYDGESEEKTKARIAEEMYPPRATSTSGDIDIDIGQKEIRIAFSNGRTVSFQSSEWGYITWVEKVTTVNPIDVLDGASRQFVKANHQYELDRESFDAARRSLNEPVADELLNIAAEVQDAAERADCAGDRESFELLDRTAEKLREIVRNTGR